MFWNKDKPKESGQTSAARPDYDACYKAAFGLAIAEIVGADDVAVKKVWDAVYGNAGNPRKQTKEVLSCLGATGWRWALYEDVLESEKGYKKMAEALVHFIETTAYQLHRREQLSEVAERRPFWKFDADDGEDVPERCRRVNGTIKHFTDPFWHKHLPPCGHIKCRCQVSSHSEQELKRNAKKA